MYYKLKQACVTNWGRYYKLGQLLQFGYNNYHRRINEVASKINIADFKFKEY